MGKTIGSAKEIVGLYLLEINEAFEKQSWKNQCASFPALVSQSSSESVSISHKEHDIMLLVSCKIVSFIMFTSNVNTPQQNGISERKNRHLLEVARALMFTSNVPKHFLGDAIFTATYLIDSQIKFS